MVLKIRERFNNHPRELSLSFWLIDALRSVLGGGFRWSELLPSDQASALESPYLSESFYGV
jgi:hypothetical protein